MHRLHEDDLAGHVMAQEDWDVVRFLAIAEEDEVWALDSELDQSLFTRRRGEALHPERQPRAILDRIRRTMGEYNFAGQYQQAPSPQGGGMVPAIRGGGIAGKIRAHRQQGKRTQRFQRLHELGRQGQGPVPIACAAQAHGISRIEACGMRAVRGVRSGWC